jgi:predicted nucleic acid-binding protein
VILDTSVIVAIALREPGYEELVGKIRSADTLGVGAPTLTEAGLCWIAFSATLEWCLSSSESNTGGRRWMPFAASAKGGTQPPSTSETA